jgi:1-acyl-sn-glycerol-3-phosphate acyltransferase
VATPIREIGRSAIESRVLEVARELLEELGSTHALPAVRGSAHLDRDLGLGSLERVELLARLERTFGASLPERVLAEADTLEDVALALAHAIGTAAPPLPAPLREHVVPAEPAARGAGPAAAPHQATTWQEVLRYRADADGARPHLILEEEGGEQTISFAELYAGSRRIALQLAERGLRPGEAVALMLPTSSEFFFCFAGVLLAGGVPVPIYPPFRADRIAEYAERQSNILRNCDARLLLTFREAERVARLLEPRVPSLRGVVTARTLLAEDPPRGRLGPPVPLPTGAAGKDLALLQYTSGSTGDPKGVMLTHANLLANVRAIGRAVGVRPDDVGVSWLPLYHDMGLIGAWLAPLYFGLPVVVLSPLAFLSRPERWLWALHRHRGTLTAAPNFAYELAVRKIADSDIAGLDLSALRAALNGAEPVLAETLERFAGRFARCGFRREAFAPVYGLAEASLALTFPPLGRGPRVDRVAREPFALEGRAVPVPRQSLADDASVTSFVSVGAVLPGHEIRIVDAAGREVGERTEGALWFRGPSATSGYFHNQKANAQLFPEGPAAGWLDSGDRAYRAEGEFFITGRVKDIILKAGRNLYPHEIEEIAGQVPGVRKGCVVAFGAPHAASGTERLVVVAETREQGREARQRIAGAITQQVALAIGLPPDAVELLRLHSIPKTSSGKLRHEETRRLYLAGSLGAAAPPPWLQIVRLAAANMVRTAAAWPRRAFDLLYGIYVAIVFALWIVPTWLLVALAPKRRVAERITTWGLRLFFVLIGCRIRLAGREHLATPPPRVFVSNHTSYFDVLVLMAALGSEYHFVAKSEVHSMLFIGTFLRKLGHFAFDRSDPHARVRQAETIEAALGRGESVFVFPEGTFTPQEAVRAFHLGAFRAAVAARCPVIPVALAGTRRFLRDGTYLPRPASIKLTICPPIAPAPGDQDASWRDVVGLRDAARAAISRASGEPLL